MVRGLILALFLWSSAFSAFGAEVLVGRVVGVHDGDTLTLLVTTGAKKESVKVRLFGVDAPESKQAFGSKAKEALSDLVFGKDVRVEVQDKDRYGRTVGRLFVGPADVNLALVRAGFAWWYQTYAKKATDLQSAEAEARAAKRGLWADKAPVPPWTFRQKPVVR